MDTIHHEHASAGHTHHGSADSGFIDITAWGSFHGSNHNSEHNELVGGRTPITTEALVAYNGLRAFAGLQAVDIDAVGNWAFANGLTNNSQAWGNDFLGVGLWYAMQGAKVGWIADNLSPSAACRYPTHRTPWQQRRGDGHGASGQT